MAGLLYKEWYQIRHSMKSFIGLMVVLGSVFCLSGDSLSFLWITGIICFSTIITTFSLDEKSGWNMYERVLEIPVKKVVLSKYILMFCFIIIGSIIGGGVNLIIQPKLWEEILASIIVVNIILILMGSIMLPLLYKFGTEKTRILFISIILIVLLGFSTLIQKLIEIDLTSIVVFGIPIITLLSLIFSIQISKKIYINKRV